MKGDFTRDTFDPIRHFSRVLMQQGRVQLDADFNEQAAILLHHLRTTAIDLGGPHWGPAGDLGFVITMDSPGELGIGKGRYYVDGILCENEAENLTYCEQEGFKGMPLPEENKNYYVYLDVWERHITHVQGDSIREKALGGPDTCTRARVVWQVRFHEARDGESTASATEEVEPPPRRTVAKSKKPAETAPSCSTAKAWLEQLPKLSEALMKARVHPERSSDDACSVPPESRYRGTENQLYRIELHRSGVAWNGVVDTEGKPAGNVMEAATFKWSRDNGSIIFPIIRQSGRIVTVESLGRDERTSLKIGDWVEVTDDDDELQSTPGSLAQVERVDVIEKTVKLKPPGDAASSDFSGLTYDERSTNHPLLRRWDHGAIEGVILHQGAILVTESSDPDSGWIEIEDGIEVQFQPVDGGAKYRSGDYWSLAARVATGRIEWPTSLTDSEEEAEAIAPHGIVHHYAPLAVIEHGKTSPTSCKCKIAPPECIEG